jgi:hypothetical protein
MINISQILVLSQPGFVRRQVRQALCGTRRGASNDGRTTG